VDKKEIILNAASEVFRRYGISKTKMSDIGRESGFKTSSLYYYFTTKEDLLQQMIARDLAKIRESLRQSIGKMSGLRAGLKKYLITRVEETEIFKRYEEFFQGSVISPPLRYFLKQQEREMRKFEHEILKDFVINHGPQYNEQADTIVTLILGISMKLSVFRSFDNDDMETINQKVESMIDFLFRDYKGEHRC